jgi:hypothetical protein
MTDPLNPDRMNPYLNYLLSEIRSVSDWSRKSKNFDLLIKIISCGFQSIGFRETSQFIHFLLSYEQKKALYTLPNFISLGDPMVSVALVFPPTIDIEFARRRRAFFLQRKPLEALEVSTLTLKELCMNLTAPERLVTSDMQVLRTVWVLQWVFPNEPVDQEKMKSSFQLLRTLEGLGELTEEEVKEKVLNLLKK